MKKMIFRILMIISVAVFLSCGSGNAVTPKQAQEGIADTINASILGIVDGDKVIIDKDVDLKGKECKIPAGRTLVFKGGNDKERHSEGSYDQDRMQWKSIR